MDGPALVVAAIIAAFALIGVISAGTFVAGQFSSSSTPKAHTSTASRLAVSDVARARRQAAAVIASANQASRQIINSATSNARQKAARIVAAARRQAAQIMSQAQNTAASTAPVTTAPQTTTTYTAPVTTAPSTTYQGTTTYQSTSASSVSPLPNLSTLPRSWLVVAYNASFGSGPGPIGGVSIMNRGSRTYSGTVVIRYNTGGSAAAPFSGLAPGQNVVLGLSGKAYSGGGYTIQVNVG